MKPKQSINTSNNINLITNGFNNNNKFDAKKESLIQQILSYRKRIQQYQALQKQVKQVSLTIDNLQSIQFNNQTNTKYSNKKQYLSSPTYNNNQKPIITSSQSFYNSNINNSINTNKKPSQQKTISASKKIKIYELQKKLYRLTKQYNQRFNLYMYDNREIEVVEQICKRFGGFIQRQNKRSKSLQEEYRQLLIGNDNVLMREQTVRQQLKTIQSRQRVYQQQKQDILAHIKSINQKVLELRKQKQRQRRQQQQQYQYRDDYQQQQSQQQIQSIQQYKPLQEKNINSSQRVKQQLRSQSNIYEVIQSMSTVNIYGNNKHLNTVERKDNRSEEKVVSSTQPTMSQNYLNYDKYNFRLHNNSKSKQYLLQQQHQQQLHNINNNNHNDIKQQQPIKHYKQKTIITPHQQQLLLQNKHQHQQHITQQLNNQIFQTQKQLTQLQTQHKHHSTNINILKHKLITYNQFIQRQKQKQLNNISTIQYLHNILQQKQGYRGQIRGRLGQKVQQITLIKMLNLTISKDIQVISNKVHSLLGLKTLLTQQLFKNSNTQ